MISRNKCHWCDMQYCMCIIACFICLQNLSMVLAIHVCSLIPRAVQYTACACP